MAAPEQLVQHDYVAFFNSVEQQAGTRCTQTLPHGPAYQRCNSYIGRSISLADLADNLASPLNNIIYPSIYKPMIHPLIHRHDANMVKA
jgi:hypothetical protein